jgi:sarcosine oxidase
MRRFDVIVVGLGAIGSAALYHLARKNVAVLGIERFDLGHDRGSSHGATRVIRLSHYERLSYIPLLKRAYALWHELEIAAGQQIVHTTGIAEIGPPDGPLVTGTLAASKTHGLEFEILQADQLMRRFPAFRVPNNFVGVVQPDGGFIEAAAALGAYIRLAIEAGAQVRTGETVLSIQQTDEAVRIETDQAVYESEAVIVALGPWTKKLLPRLPVTLEIKRQVVGWFEPNELSVFSVDKFPVFLLESRHGIHFGLPKHTEPGIKLAKHYPYGPTIDPDNCDRLVTPDDEAGIRSAIAEFVPAASGRLVAAKTCMYTLTPDGTFIIDRLPNSPGIIVASPCCGHGFKFAPIVGEILSDLATIGMTEHDISDFRLERFS